MAVVVGQWSTADPGSSAAAELKTIGCSSETLTEITSPLAILTLPDAAPDHLFAPVGQCSDCCIMRKDETSLPLVAATSPTAPLCDADDDGDLFDHFDSSWIASPGRFVCFDEPNLVAKDEALVSPYGDFSTRAFLVGEGATIPCPSESPCASATPCDCALQQVVHLGSIEGCLLIDSMCHRDSFDFLVASLCDDVDGFTSPLSHLRTHLWSWEDSDDLVPPACVNHTGHSNMTKSCKQFWRSTRHCMPAADPISMPLPTLRGRLLSRFTNWRK
eukprot:4246268-Amphidinium_carterae.1